MSICDKLEKFRDDLKFMVDLTRTEGIEHGVKLCENKDGKVLLGSKMSGDIDSVEVVDCPLNTIEVGFFHTHPSGTIAPSPDDIRYLYQRGGNKVCTANDVGNVTCIDFENRGVVPFNVPHSLTRLYDEAEEEKVRKASTEILKRQPVSSYRRDTYPPATTIEALDRSSWREGAEKPIMNELLRRDAKICHMQL